MGKVDVVQCTGSKQAAGTLRESGQFLECREQRASGCAKVNVSPGRVVHTGIPYILLTR